MVHISIGKDMKEKILYKTILVYEVLFLILFAVLTLKGIDVADYDALMWISLLSFFLVIIITYIRMKEHDVQDRGVLVMLLVLNMMWFAYF